MGGRDRRSIALEITIYLTLGALISLGGLVALNVMVDSAKFDFPSLSNAILRTVWEAPLKIRFSDCSFRICILVALFLFTHGQPWL